MNSAELLTPCGGDTRPPAHSCAGGPSQQHVEGTARQPHGRTATQNSGDPAAMVEGRETWRNAPIAPSVRKKPFEADPQRVLLHQMVSGYPPRGRPHRLCTPSLFRARDSTTSNTDEEHAAAEINGNQNRVLWVTESSEDQWRGGLRERLNRR